MNALKNVNIDDIVFIDIETAQIVPELKKDMPLWDSWDYKVRRDKDTTDFSDETLIALYNQRAALHAEFAKIICISIGKIKDGVLKVKSYSQPEEKDLLIAFGKDIDNIVAANKKTVLAGHAIKVFDLPYIMRRCIVNQLAIPNIIDSSNLKPWEISHLDTAELWKGSGFAPSSLIAIAVSLGIKSPKDDIEGKDTSRVYWQEKTGLERIVTYCEKDILTVANIINRFMYLPLIEAQKSEIKEKQVGLLQKAYNTGSLNGEETSKLMKNYAKLSEEEKPLADEILTIARKTK